MSSSRVLLCDLCIILLFGLHVVLAIEQQHPVTLIDDVAKGNCSCGGFATKTIGANDTPLLSQTPGLVVKCDVEGENTCMSLCNALAIATKAKGPEVLCNKLNNAKELKLSAFYKTCEGPWTYANLTAHEPLCCDEGLVKTCPSLEKNDATETVKSKIAM